MICKTSGDSPSAKLKIDDELTAFQFDAACEYVYRNRQGEHETEKMKVLIKSIGLLLGGKDKYYEDDSEDMEAY